jgi:hypothetical protein
MSKPPSKAWREIGDVVHIDEGKVGHADRTFYQCAACGSVWMRTRESGALGKNTFYQSLTERFS